MSAIRLSAPDWCFYRPGIDAFEYYERLARAGISGAEMVAPERFAAARSAGLELVNLAAPGMTRGLNRLAHHGELLPRIAATIRAAAEAGIPFVIVFSGNRAGQPDEEGIDGVARGIETLLPLAESARVTLLFEMLNTHDHADYQADATRYGVALHRRLAHPSFKLLYDAYHMARMGEDVVRDVEDHFDVLGHVHLASTPDRSAPRADGGIALDALVTRIVQRDYAGWFGLEYLPGKDLWTELAAVVRVVRSARSQ